MPKTKLISRSTDYRIGATLGRSEFVGWKCRPVLTKPEEEIPIDVSGYIFDLQAYMLSGEFEGMVVELPPCKLTLAPVRKCSCSAYKFPHAPGFGQCKETKFEQVAPTGIKLEDLFQ